MTKKIAWTLLFIGLFVTGFSAYLRFFLHIEIGDMLIWIILSFVLVFSGSSLLSIAQNFDNKIVIRKYFLVIFLTLLSTSIISFITNLNTLFLWFYIITVLFFAFGFTPLNASIRIQKWTRYLNSKVTVKILGSADHLGILFFVIGLTWKSMHWPFANFLLILGIVLLVLAAVTWNIVFRKQIILRIEKEEQLKEKSKEISDSINYAKRLQYAILPSLNAINEHIPHNFILFQPKDAVSGDFYWFEHKNNLNLIASADCTGHGVPGAMVSVVCSNALHRTVNEFGILEPSKILDKTRELVIETFTKSGESVKDGMDIALCVFSKNKVTFSGANNPLWIVRETNELSAEQLKNKSTYTISELSLIEFKADKQPIGLYEGMKPFTQTEIELKPNDMLYFFTDGFADQFGGKKGKKFKYIPFKKLLIEISPKPMNEQKEAINSAFNNWKGEIEQIDDVCVIGIKIK
jgi:serine phosphatase RsbU (regulator of sigma subunit)